MKGFWKIHFTHTQRGTPMNELMDSTNNYPYIIAIRDLQNEITEFYIEVEKHLLLVSTL